VCSTGEGVGRGGVGGSGGLVCGLCCAPLAQSARDVPGSNPARAHILMTARGLGDERRRPSVYEVENRRRTWRLHVYVLLTG